MTNISDEIFYFFFLIIKIKPKTRKKQWLLISFSCLFSLIFLLRLRVIREFCVNKIYFMSQIEFSVENHNPLRGHW